MLEQCNFYQHQIMSSEVQALQDKCDFYLQEVMKAENMLIVKTMPIDLDLIKEHQDTEKCVKKRCYIKMRDSMSKILERQDS